MSQRSPLSGLVLCGQYSVWYLEKGGGSSSCYYGIIDKERMALCREV